MKLGNLEINSNDLVRVSCFKFLGVFLDEKLKWVQHINYISLKVSKGVEIISRLRNILPASTLKILYYTLIYPHLSYCTIVWGAACDSVISKLNSLQNRALRLITHSPYRSSVNPLFVKLNVLKIYDVYKLQNALFMFKLKESLVPNCCKKYCIVNQQRVYTTRNPQYFCVGHFRTCIREKSVSVYGPLLWASLPIAIQNCTSLNIVKRDFSALLISSYL